jgi:hypothetical protein
MRRVMPGAAAGRYSGQWSACTTPPWPAGTGSLQCGSGRSDSAGLTRTHGQRCGWMHVVRMYWGICIWGRACAHACARAHADSHTSRSATSARTHTRTRRRSRACRRARTHARTPAQYSPMSVVPHMRTHTDTRTNTQTRPLAGSQIRTHMYACGCVCMCAHTQTSHMHARALAHKRTHARLNAPTAHAAVCARARSAAGPRRSISPRRTGTRTWRRRCSRTAPTCTRRPITGAAAGRCFGQPSACPAPPWLTGTGPIQCIRDGIVRAMHSRTHAHRCGGLHGHTYFYIYIYIGIDIVISVDIHVDIDLDRYRYI